MRKAYRIVLSDAKFTRSLVQLLQTAFRGEKVCGRLWRLGEVFLALNDRELLSFGLMILKPSAAAVCHSVSMIVLTIFTADFRSRAVPRRPT